jgi:hypothetical protein
MAFRARVTMVEGASAPSSVRGLFALDTLIASEEVDAGEGNTLCTGVEMCAGAGGCAASVTEVAIALSVTGRGAASAVGVCAASVSASAVRASGAPIGALGEASNSAGGATTGEDAGMLSSIGVSVVAAGEEAEGAGMLRRSPAVPLIAPNEARDVVNSSAPLTDRLT